MMKVTAIIEAERPGLDSVILWDDDGRLVAFAYLNGQVKMTRPLAATNLDDAVREVRDNFQINAGQLTRIHDWHDTVARTERFALGSKRWN